MCYYYCCVSSNPTGKQRSQHKELEVKKEQSLTFCAIIFVALLLLLPLLFLTTGCVNTIKYLTESHIQFALYRPCLKLYILKMINRGSKRRRCGFIIIFFIVSFLSVFSHKLMFCTGTNQSVNSVPVGYIKANVFMTFECEKRLHHTFQRHSLSRCSIDH